MTDTERLVHQACERIMASGHVRLYRDLYLDLRERLPCGAACRLIAEGLHATRTRAGDRTTIAGLNAAGARARAIAALKRLKRYAEPVGGMH